MHDLNYFYTQLSGAPQKCFKSGPALANAGPVSIRSQLSKSNRISRFPAFLEFARNVAYFRNLVRFSQVLCVVYFFNYSLSS